MKITVDNLKAKLVEVLTLAGATELDATVVADEIIYGQIRGKKSHGLLMLPSMVKRASKGADRIKVLSDSEQFAFLDGCECIGPVVSKRAMDISVEKTLNHGFSIVGVKNPYPFITAGYPVWNVVNKHKLIAIDISVANSKVAPYGSTEPIFGTNPIGFAFPTKEHPIVIDMSITKIPAAKIKQSIESGKLLPENVALDNEGNFTTDPNKALKGALTTFGGYKSSAIALMVELLAGAFLNQKCGKQNGEMRAMLFFTCKPDLFVDMDSVLRNASNLRNDINNSRPISPDDPARTPGDNAELLMNDALQNGIMLSVSEQQLLEKVGVSL
ncbi:MAG: Ldh family oxidoreductase [Oscillospiraceae bacterium]|jgi:L-2-hydroxycarboxylate dehydrogenase (NAD+)|nr:Ldh family oxidoreductase [Oscillospiraceae bacterium]